MKHVVKHDLEASVAKQATVKAFEAYQAQYAKYNPTLHWATEERGDIGFEAKGVKLKGNVTVRTGAIELDLDVPFLLRPFAGKAVEVIEREIEKWITKAKAGAL